MYFTRMRSPGFLLCFVLCALSARAATNESFTIDRLGLRPSGVEIMFASRSNAYYILWRGETIDSITNPVHVALGQGGAGLLVETNSNPSVAGF